MAMLHLEDAPTYDEDEYSKAEICNLVQGPIGRAIYNSADCELKRQHDARTAVKSGCYGAYPDGSEPATQTSVFINYYALRFITETIHNQPITMLSSEDLVSFYQTYHITKDAIAYQAPSSNSTSTIQFGVSDDAVKRPIKVRLHVVQVNLICVLVCGIAAIVVILGFINHVSFITPHRHHLHRAPQSKLDWVSQIFHIAPEDGAGPDTADASSLVRTKLSYATIGGRAERQISLSSVSPGKGNDDRKSLVDKSGATTSPREMVLEIW